MSAASMKANEPSMEEILASIRRIISDDEAESAESPPACSPEAEAAEVDADADTKIIDDIARVLSGAAPADSATALMKRRRFNAPP